MKIMPLEDQIARRCVHFTGMMNRSCKAGVVYAKVPKPAPCIKWDDELQRGECPQCRYPTKEEVAAEVAEIRKATDQFTEDIKQHRCPHCKRPVERYKQVGRCVYARPCGHRQYQGRGPKEMTDIIQESDFEDEDFPSPRPEQEKGE